MFIGTPLGLSLNIIAQWVMDILLCEKEITIFLEKGNVVHIGVQLKEVKSL